METKTLMGLAKRRAASLRITLEDIHGLGAYDSAPLSHVEFCMHEAAHLIVLGYPPEKFGVWLDAFCPQGRDFQSALSTWLTATFSTDTGDALEIDTAVVTYLAGRSLKLWTDSEAIQRSCIRNLSAVLIQAKDRAHVHAQFAAAEQKSYKTQVYYNHARTLARWFAGRSRLNFSGR